MSLLITLAVATGWDEQHLLHMPLARAMQYMHGYAIHNGAATEWAEATEGEHADLMRKLETAHTPIPDTYFD